MTEQVLISIRGLQFMGTEEDAEPIELVTVGNYYWRNRHSYILFEESFEGFDETAHNLIKITDTILEVRKKGIVNVHMVFEREKKNISYYATPFGTMEMGIAATNMDIARAEHEIAVKVDYALEINQEYQADCSLAVTIKSKKAEDFALS